MHAFPVDEMPMGTDGILHVRLGQGLSLDNSVPVTERLSKTTLLGFQVAKPFRATKRGWEEGGRIGKLLEIWGWSWEVGTSTGLSATESTL